MLAQARLAVADLTRSALSLRPLAAAGEPFAAPLEVAAPAADGCLTPAEVLGVVATRLGVIASAEREAGGFASIVAARLREPLSRAALARIPAVASTEIEATVDEVVAASFDAFRCPTDVPTADGALLRTYAAGAPGSPAVVIASACGMPAHLSEHWMRLLARDHRVVIWETRDLFGDLGDPAAFDARGHGVAEQAADLISVMDHHGLATAHVMGMCGGAVLALCAAGRRPDRISSLSLWHGDYELGPATPRTTHQRNLAALMAMAANSRDDAKTINAALLGTTMAAVPAEVAHLVVYPYVDADVFYRYCVLTGAIMAADVAALLPAVQQPSLVVTSEDDTTAHPAGSHRVAGALTAGMLRVQPHGDHISVFKAGPPLARLLADFLAGA